MSKENIAPENTTAQAPAAKEPRAPKAQAPAVANPANDYKKLESDGVFPVKPLTAKAFDMATVISGQPKVTTIVPLRDDEAIGGAFHTWQENGFKVHVLKGVAVQLPQQVAKAITDEYTATARATREVQVRNPITNELVNMNLEQKSEQDRAYLGA